MDSGTLRGLLAAVEAHGGPVATYLTQLDNEPYVKFLVGPAWKHAPVAWPMTNGADDLLVGVLKRDLIERGVHFKTKYKQGEGWFAAIWGFESAQRMIEEPGGSELEAILHAWLAAAEAEGWKGEQP